MKTIFKIFSIFNRSEKKYCLFIIFSMIIGAILEAVGIGAILPLISIMGDAEFLEKHIILKEGMNVLSINNHTTFIISSACLLIFFYILKNLYMTWLMKLQIRFSLNNQVYFAGKLLETYICKPYLYHLNQNSATLLRNVSGGAIVVFTNIIVSSFNLITEMITAVVIWGMLILVDPFMALIVAGALGGMVYVILKGFRRKITKQGKIQNEYSAFYMKWLNQGLGAIKETKVLHKEFYFINEFNKVYKLYGNANAKFLFYNQLPRMFIETLVTSGLLILIVAKLWLGERPQEIVPLLGLLALAAFRLMPCANRIVNLSNTIKFNMPLFETLYEELISIRNNRCLIAKDEAMSKNLSKVSFIKEIDIKKLRFSYPHSEQIVLKDISFKIPKGAFVGIIGQSGAGKTTFVDILLGLLEPTNGKILVDGQNIFQCAHKWQAILSYVPQSIYLIDGTISENIALGIPEKELDRNKLEKVLKMAELYEFIQNLPDKLETKVGERGVKLSGGQRQRIGISRALYCDPEVLILDEATSALDNETEKNITDTILKLRGQITIIAIAHRVSTLENCDFKIKFDEGKVEILD